MTARTSRITYSILAGFLAAQIIYLGLSTPVHAQAALLDNAGFNTTPLNCINDGISTLPDHPHQNGADSDEYIDSENDDDPLRNPLPVHAIDHIVFDYPGTANSNNKSQCIQVAAANIYHLTAIYMLTERYRL
jgi:hypothetical protein